MVLTSKTTHTDAAGQPSSRVASLDAYPWEFEYDLMGNPLKMIYPDGTFIAQEYDIAGRLSKFTNKRGQEISYAYDSFGKLISKTTPEGEIVFSYDGRERLAEIIAPDFHYSYQYGYSTDGPVLQQDELISNTMLQTTNNRFYGMPVYIYDGFGWSKRFYYDSLALGSSPRRIDNWWHGTALDFMASTMDHDAARRMTYRKNDVFIKREYFSYANGLLKQSRYIAAEPYFTASGSLTYGRDISGLITSISGDKQLNATYDPDLQISSIAHTLPQPFAESYTYDDNGNRLTSLSNSFIYDDLNKLTESTTHEYTYDADGNMTSERNKLTGETKKYYWDSQNRLIGFEHRASDIAPIDIAAAYKYDIFGRRLQKNVNNVITNFFWEGDTLAYELNEQYQPVRKYLTTGLAMDDYEGHLEYSETTDWSRIFDHQYCQGWYSYMRDQVGTIYKVYDHRNHQVADARAYDTFGNLVNQSGTTKTPLGFQGKYYDQESGLNYFYHRYYNPALGRFISEDPIGLEGGLNIFVFALNDPIELSDKFGLNSWSNEHEEWMKLFCRMWASRRVRKGLSGDEYGSWLFPKGGEAEEDWWDSGKKNECSPKKNPPPVPFLMGSVHTHPRGKSRYASPPADTDVAEKYHPGLPMYIISELGISAYISGKGNIHIMDYSDFRCWCKSHGLW